MRHGLDVVDQLQAPRPNHHKRAKVAQHRAQSQLARQGYCDNVRNQEDGNLGEHGSRQVRKRNSQDLKTDAWINHSHIATGCATTSRNASGVLGGAFSVGTYGVGLMAGLAVFLHGLHAAARLQLRFLIANSTPKIQLVIVDHAHHLAFKIFQQPVSGTLLFPPAAAG